MITCDNLTFQSKTNSYLRVSLFFGPHLLHFRFWARMAYEEKKKLLFDCLLTAEKSIAGTSLEQKESSTHHRPIRSDESKAVSRRFHGKESIFKRPAAPIAKCLKPRRAPDYQVNPHKWKKYSLSDVDISDRSNSSAAFAFLKEIEKRKDQLDANDDNDQMSSQITFKKRDARKEPKFQKSASLRSVVTEDAEDGDTKSKMKGSKLVMPEYVIGQKPTNKKRKLTSSTTTNKSSSKHAKDAPKLLHLMEEEEKEAEDSDTELEFF